MERSWLIGTGLALLLCVESLAAELSPGKAPAGLQGLQSSERTTALVDTLVHADDNAATEALRKALESVESGYACLPFILNHLSDCQGSIDVIALTKEEGEPKWLRPFPARRYATLFTRRGVVLARLADFVRESPDSPERTAGQEPLLNAFFQTLHASKGRAPERGGELMVFARRVVLYDSGFIPKHGAGKLWNFVNQCSAECSDWSSDAVSGLESVLFQLALDVPEYRERASVFFEEFTRRFGHEGDMKIREAIPFRLRTAGNILTEEDYWQIRVRPVGELVNTLTHVYREEDLTLLNVILEEICGSRTALCENWERIWPLVVSLRPPTNLLHYVARPLPPDARSEEKAHVDALVQFVWDSLKGEARVDNFRASEYASCLGEVAAIRSVRQEREAVTPVYGREKVLEILLDLLTSENTRAVIDALPRLGALSWVGEATAQRIHQRLVEFKQEVAVKDWKKMAAHYPEPRNAIEPALKRALSDSEEALEYFAAKEKKQ